MKRAVAGFRERVGCVCECPETCHRTDICLSCGPAFVPQFKGLRLPVFLLRHYALGCESCLATNLFRILSCLPKA